MRFLADENFPGFAVAMLRSIGHEVDWISETAPGAKDDQVLDRAIRMGAIILTCDRDFAQWARGMRKASGIGVFVF